MPYYPPGQADLNHLRHLELLVLDHKDPLTEEKIRYDVAHIDKKGKPDGWFFDSFLPIAGRLPSGNFAYADVNLGTTRCGCGDFFAMPSSNPGTAQDWQYLLDWQFGKDGILPLLDKVIGDLKKQLGNPEHTHNVVITVPYPQPNQYSFGCVKPGGRPLNFTLYGQNLDTATAQRLDACEWYTDNAIRMWKKAKFKNLNLLGFYWCYESIHYSWEVDDHVLVKEYYKYVRSRNYRLLWIPFYSSFNVHMMSDSRGFYFDCAFLQPNHMFYPDIQGVGQAAEEAAARGGGVEMEYLMSGDPLYNLGIPERHIRLRNYLNGGVDYKYMTESALAYFLGFNDMHRMAQSKLRAERELYHDLHAFVRGRYQKKCSLV